MVGVAQRDHVVVAGVGARHEHGEVVRFRAGVDEVADLELARHLRGELLGVLGDVRVQIDRGGMLEELVLLPRRFDDVGMTMPDADGDDAAEGVEVTPAALVPDVLHFAFHEGERLFVVEEDARVQELLAQAVDLVGRRAGVGLRLVVEGRQFRCLA